MDNLFLYMGLQLSHPTNEMFQVMEKVNGRVSSGAC
jgi:hypothetical protein